MNTFIEQHKSFLKFYYGAIRLSGWILLTLGLGGVVISLIIVRNLGATAQGIASINMPLTSGFILFGLLGLGIGQLIRYMVDPDCRQGFILRHGGKFIYAYVMLIFVLMITRNLIAFKYVLNTETPTAHSVYWGTVFGSFILFAAQALILIGLAQFLKRIMPVIEEHKSLV